MGRSTQPITPRFAESLRLLAASQLQAQVSRSGTLDAGALGVMAIDATVAAIVVGTRDTRDLWIVALALLGLSLGVAVRALLRPGATLTGPLVMDVLNARATLAEEDLEQGLLEDLAMETLANEQALAHKDPMIAVAVALLVLAIVIELAGRL